MHTPFVAELPNLTC